MYNSPYGNSFNNGPYAPKAPMLDTAYGDGSGGSDRNNYVDAGYKGPAQSYTKPNFANGPNGPVSGDFGFATNGGGLQPGGTLTSNGPQQSPQGWTGPHGYSAADYGTAYGRFQGSGAPPGMNFHDWRNGGMYSRPYNPQQQKPPTSIVAPQPITIDPPEYGLPPDDRGPPRLGASYTKPYFAGPGGP